MALTIAAAPQFISSSTLDAANVPANSVSQQTFTVTGVRLDTKYHVDALSLEAGLFIIQARPTAINTLEISFLNASNADINPVSQTFRIIGF